jgi:cytidine deaminase
MATLDHLFEAAKAAREKAHVPYSRFKVGSAILSDDGQIYAGCNVENAAYPSGTCAEAGAIAAMVLGGGRAIREMLVIGDGPMLCTPCGNCRQRIREFAKPDTPVHVAGLEGLRQSFTLEDLLPASFGPENLG